MRVLRLSKEYEQSFLDYCKMYGKEHDESYITDFDMKDKDFTNLNENPTFILLDNNDIVGVLSLMVENNFGKGMNKYRFRIFHTLDKKYESYKLLFDELLIISNNIDELFLFIPMALHKSYMSNVFKDLGFKVERYSFVMERESKEYNKPELKENTIIKSIDINDELETFCDIRNESFKKLAGSTDRDVDYFNNYINSDCYIKDGLMMIYEDKLPIGILCVGRDEDDPLDEVGIEAIGISPKYQGKGYGRQLLRKGIGFALDKGYKKVWLSVHGENDKATNLYTSEGFKITQEIVCYNWKKGL